MPDSPASPSALLRAATVLVFLVGLAGIAGAVYELGQAQRAWASLKVARAEYATEQTQSRILVRNAEVRGREVSELQKAAESAGAAPGGALANSTSAGNDASPSGWDNKKEMQLFLNAYPEVRGMLESLAKGQFQAAFGAFLRTANLSPSQADQLEAAITENWMNHLALGPKGGFSTTSQLPPASQLQAILGDSGAQQLQDYARALPAQTVATQIANSNGYAGTPLSADQSAQLAQLIAANSTAYQNGKKVSLDTVNWAAAAAQAQSVLSPQQAALAGNVFAKEQYQQSVQAARQAARAAAGK